MVSPQEPANKAAREPVVGSVKKWLAEVVIGLNLCPFARKPMRSGQLRYCVSSARDDGALMAGLVEEMQLLDMTPANELESTLVILPQFLQDFLDFNDFIALAEGLIEQQGYSGVYQLATFHPHYQFSQTAANDAENLTNRAPYPILQLIREASIDRVLKNYPDPQAIPENNIRCMQKLSEAEKHRLFPYLFPPSLA